MGCVNLLVALCRLTLVWGCPNFGHRNPLQLIVSREKTILIAAQVLQSCCDVMTMKVFETLLCFFLSVI